MNIALKINRFRWDCPFSGQYIQVVARFLVMRLEIGAERVANNVKKWRVTLSLWTVQLLKNIKVKIAYS